jgi:hypothetical protein
MRDGGMFEKRQCGRAGRKEQSDFTFEIADLKWRSAGKAISNSR